LLTKFWNREYYQITIGKTVPFIEVDMIVEDGLWRRGRIAGGHQQFFAIAFYGRWAEIVDQLAFQVADLPGILCRNERKKQYNRDGFSHKKLVGCCV
jgi:hypothetical protein